MAQIADRVVRLTSVRTELEAGVVVGALEARGIQATMSGVYTANFRTEAPGWVEVLVGEDDLGEAQAVLAEVGDEREEVDWSQVDVGQPEENEGSQRYAWFPVFRRVCLALVALYLFWIAFNLGIGLLQMALGVAMS